MQRSLKMEIALSRSLFQRNLRPEACYPQMGIERIKMKEIKDLPVLLGKEMF